VLTYRPVKKRKRWRSDRRVKPLAISRLSHILHFARGIEMLVLLGEESRKGNMKPDYLYSGAAETFEDPLDWTPAVCFADEQSQLESISPAHLLPPSRNGHCEEFPFDESRPEPRVVLRSGGRFASVRSRFVRIVRALTYAPRP